MLATIRSLLLKLNIYNFSIDIEINTLLNVYNILIIDNIIFHKLRFGKYIRLITAAIA